MLFIPEASGRNAVAKPRSANARRSAFRKTPLRHVLAVVTGLFLAGSRLVVCRRSNAPFGPVAWQQCYVM